MDVSEAEGVADPLVTALWWVMTLSPTLVNLAHGVYVCNVFRSLCSATSTPTHWLASLVLSVGACVVGGAVRCILLGLRVEFLASNWIIPVNMAAWWLVNYSPFDFVRKSLELPPVSAVLIALEMVHKARTITSAVDLAVKTITTPVWVGPLIIGTLANCAGGFYKGAVERAMLGKAGVSELSKPTNAIKLGFYVSVFYFYATDPYHQLSAPLLAKDVATLSIIYYMVLVAGLPSVFLGPYTPFPINLVERLLAALGPPAGTSGPRPGKGAKERKQV